MGVSITPHFGTTLAQPRYSPHLDGPRCRRELDSAGAERSDVQESGVRGDVEAKGSRRNGDGVLQSLFDLSKNSKKLITINDDDHYHPSKSKTDINFWPLPVIGAQKIDGGI